MNSSFEIVTVGNAIIDAFLLIHDTNIHCRLDEKTGELCVKHGEKILLDNAEFVLGGNACNVSVGLSRLGNKTALCAEIGSDEFSPKIVNGLTAEHVDLSLLQQTPGARSSFAIGINFKGDRTLFIEHIKRKHEFKFDLVETPWLFLTSLGNEWHAAYNAVAAYALSHKVQLAFNPGSYQLEAGRSSIEKLLQLSHILFVNKQEAQRLLESQEPDISALLSKLQELGPQIIVITDGKNGSFVRDVDGRKYTLPIFAAPIIERTGAGDAFASGFLGATIQGAAISEAMRWGAINAAGVIQKVGAQAGLLTKEQMQRELDSHQEFQAEEI